MAQDSSDTPAADHGLSQYNWYPWQEKDPEATRRRQEEGSSPSDYIQAAKYSYAGVQGGGQAGPPVVQSPNAHCRLLGHKWRTNGLYENARVEEFICERCNMTKKTTVAWGGIAAAHTTITPDAARELLAMAEPKPIPWVCFYCGDTFEDEDVLLDHEDDCAEA